MLSLIIILLIFNLGASFVFILRLILKKSYFSERIKTHDALSAGLTVSWCVFILYFIVGLGSIFYHPNRNFDQTRWLNSPRTRYELTDDLIERKLLIGKTKTEVKQLLGNEEGKMEDYGGYNIHNSDNSNEWEYFIGFESVLSPVEASFLEIDFKDEKVVNVYKASQ